MESTDSFEWCPEASGYRFHVRWYLETQSAEKIVGLSFSLVEGKESQERRETFLFFY